MPINLPKGVFILSEKYFIFIQTLIYWPMINDIILSYQTSIIQKTIFHSTFKEDPFLKPKIFVNMKIHKIYFIQSFKIFIAFWIYRLN